MNETLVVNPGENVTVQCLLTGGDPLPQLQWSHGPGLLPLGALAQGGTLSIPSVQARDSGYYNCTATNNVGNPAKKTVNLLVRCTWVQRGGQELKRPTGSLSFRNCEMKKGLRRHVPGTLISLQSVVCKQMEGLKFI